MNEPLLIITIEALITILVVLNAFAFATLWERKLLGRFQARYGPNRAGPVGYMQPLADLLKLVFKEDFVPDGANRVLFQIAPVISVITAVTAIAMIPFGDPIHVDGYTIQLVGANVSVGLLVLFAEEKKACFRTHPARAITLDLEERHATAVEIGVSNMGQAHDLVVRGLS